MAMRPLVLAAITRLGIGITAEMQMVLDKHNVYRCMHGVPLFTWDDAIAANAQAWADGGKYEHSANSDRTTNGEVWGENLARGMTGVESTQAWYSEVQFTKPWGTADSFTDSTDPTEAIGHYTQVVWSTSLRLGCGKGTVTVSGNTQEYWVCQYGPAGNMQGQFSAKVKAPVKEATQCGGTSADVPSKPGDALPPSSCRPNAPLPHGSLCVYGYQCESKFCCPRLKVCLKSATASVGSNEIKVAEANKTKIVGIVFGGTCKPSSMACYQSQDGEPLPSWNQESCGCNEEYMTHYRAGTWVTLNDIPGLVCESAVASTTAPGGRTSSDAAMAPSRSALPIAFMGAAAAGALATLA